MAAYDLCTTAEVKEFLQISESSFDAVLASLVSRASKAILNFTSREFAPVTASASREFWYEGGNSLDVAPYDLRTITSVQIDTEGSAPITLVADTDYFLYPKPAVDGVYQRLELPNHDTTSRREITVAGAWGFSEIPVDVKHWAIVTVAEWYRKDSAAFSTAYNVESGFLERPEMLPRAAMAGLAHYRRISVG